MKYKITTQYKQRLSDTITPVSVYLRLRDKFANTILLESSDYHGNENSFSYICCQPIARFEITDGRVTQNFPDGRSVVSKLDENMTAVACLSSFINSFETENLNLKFISNGLFGYQSYDAVRYYDNIHIKDNATEKIPDVLYHAYRYVLAINHFNNTIHLFEHLTAGETSQLHHIEDYINLNTNKSFHFQRDSEESSNFSDNDFLDILQKGKDHCQRGDVFQIVLSRRFKSAFKGDEFNVYRALRAINPSPYLFYFDYGSFKLFGSSPEAQIVIGNGKASIHPIAGTFKRTGDDKADAQLAERLANDVKENAEHVMLVDLARNDLSRHGYEVHLETYREVQFYSHVIHLVSKVSCKVEQANPLQLVADTFPAGTLSGAPKYMAMQLINQYENQNRNYYGGCIGYLGFNGSFNHAIMIRSFLSTKNELHYQAGAGVTIKSDTQSELEEVNNKLRALRKALEMAENI